MGAQRKIESPEMLDKHINDFIDKCEKGEEIPSDYALCKFLSISPTTLECYMTEGRTEDERERGTYKGYSIPMKKLINYREHRLLRMIESSKGNNAGAIFQLKQKKNGGYTDAPVQQESNASITLKIEGIGGIEAFQ